MDHQETDQIEVERDALEVGQPRVAGVRRQLRGQAIHHGDDREDGDDAEGDTRGRRRRVRLEDRLEADMSNVPRKEAHVQHNDVSGNSARHALKVQLFAK